MLSRSLLAPAILGVGPALVVAAGGSLSCPIDAPLSCQNTTSYDNTCCFNYPGGQVLLTQFWDTNPSTGPVDSWTIHGLWPDNCDGTWEQFCDSNREYTNISSILARDAPCTLEYMQRLWPDYQGDDESFWEHEFNKHGTCMSTLEPSCYPAYQAGDEVVDYFKRAVKLFRTLPSYDWLAEAGIEPSTTKTYTLAEIQAALKAHHGSEAIVNCHGKELNELWYHFNIQGSIQSGSFMPVGPVGSPSTCPATGIKYLPKYEEALTTTTTTTTTAAAGTTTTSTSTTTAPPTEPTGDAEVLSGRGRFYVSSEGVANGGFLISGGTWYRGGGTPATYTATPVADGTGFVLNTSRGRCAVQEDASLLCAASVLAEMASSFGYDGTYLTYEGSRDFYAEAVPSGTAQGTVFVAQKAVSFRAAWTAV